MPRLRDTPHAWVEWSCSQRRGEAVHAGLGRFTLRRFRVSAYSDNQTYLARC